MPKLNEELITIGVTCQHWNASESRILKYSVEISHKGLNEHKILSAPDDDVLENKVNIQTQKWKERWESIELKRQAQEKKEANFKKANIKTEEAQTAFKQIDNLLISALSNDDMFTWHDLKKKDKFPERKPTKPEKKRNNEFPAEPNSNKFLPQFTFFEKLIKSKKEKKIQEFNQKYLNAIKNWEKRKQSIKQNNAQINKKYADALKGRELRIAEWEKRKELFYIKQNKFNAKIDQMESAYFKHDINAITEYCKHILNNSKYPNIFPKEFEIEYNPKNKILIIEYRLPSIEYFPKIKEIKYNISKNDFKECYISDTELKRIFNETMYKITLRTIYELFKADTAKVIQLISFNGWINAINRATGKEENNCILSIQVNKEELKEINLLNIDPKSCFIKLKGVASTNLSSVTPIQPILQINKEDKRFVDSYAVAGSIDNTTNIAAMDWEDFEHLIRELFEKEFSSNGGEVKVTQASRDGGVDAIAFDPDPIRGGKIVIQAKRYTNTVGLSAVRDLYGTVVNEGATKGILITTADYGPEAYKFVADKPLTLLNGSNLLHLLEKHGHHAKIDIKEAKKILTENEL